MSPNRPDDQRDDRPARRPRPSGGSSPRDGGGDRGGSAGGYRGGSAGRTGGGRPAGASGGYRGSSDRPSYGDRQGGSGYRGGSDRPRTGGGYRGSSDRPSYGDRERSGGYRGSSDRPSYGDRQGGSGYRGGSDRPRTGGGYRGSSDRPSYGDRPRTGGGYRGSSDRPSYGDRPRSTGGYRGSSDRPSYGDRPRAGGGYRGSSDRPSYGDRPRTGGGYRGSSDRPSYGDRQGGEGYRGSSDRPSDGDRERSGGYRGSSDRPRGAGGYRGGADRTSGPRRDREGAAFRPTRRFVEPGIGDEQGAFSSEESPSLERAATIGRNLWNPAPAGAKRPGRADAPGGRKSAGVRRSTNTVGGEQVEGRQAVRELLAAGLRPVSEVWLIEGTDPAPILGEIDNLARKANVPVRMVSPRRLAQVQRTETPQGVVAFAEPLDSHDLTELVLGEEPEAGEDAGEKAARPVPFLVVVDGVTDPQNLGAVLRSAECAGATGAVLPRHRAVHVTAAVAKAAAGAIEHLPIALVAGIPSALAQLSELGVRTIGLDERGDQSVFDLALGEGPVALVLGAEGRGLSPLSRKRCDLLASIPLHGAIPSLNVSTAAAVACFEVARGRKSVS